MINREREDGRQTVHGMKLWILLKSLVVLRTNTRKYSHGMKHIADSFVQKRKQLANNGKKLFKKKIINKINEEKIVGK